jgi:hypothetical protein
MIVKKIDVFVYIADQLIQRNLAGDEVSSGIDVPHAEKHSKLHASIVV